MPRSSSRTAVISFRARIGRATRDIQRLGTRLRGLQGLQRGLIGGFTGSTSALMGTGAAFGALALAGRGAVRTYEDYSRAQARMRGILATTGVDLRGQRVLMESADIAARRYGLGMADAAEAMNVMAETGVGVHGASRYFQIASEFATAANTDVTDASNVLIGSMRQFNMESERGARVLAGSFTLAARLSSTSIQELQHAFRYSATEFATFGYSAQETVSALSALSAIGIKGSSAGTRLRMMMFKLNQITPQTRRLMNRLGVSNENLNSIMYDSAGRTRPLVDATRRLAAMFMGLRTQQERNQVSMRLFGVRASSAGALLGQIHSQGRRWLDTYRALNDEERVMESVHEAAEQNMRGFAAQMRLARTASQEFGIAFMEMVLGPMDNAEQGFGSYLRDLATAIRYQDDSVEHTAALTTAYSELSPEMRETAREVREVMVGLSEFLKQVWEITKAVAKFAAENPKLAASLAGLMIVGPSLLGMLASTVTILGSLGTVVGAVAGLFSSLNAASFALAFAGVALSPVLVGIATVLAVILAIPLGQKIGEWIIGMTGMSDELNHWDSQMQRSLDSWHLGWTQSIPVLSGIVRFIWRIVDVIRTMGGELKNALGSWWSRQTFDAEATLRSRTGRFQRGGRSYGEATREAGRLELSETIMELAGSMRSENMNVIEAERRFGEAISRAGVEGESFTSAMEQFRRAFSSQSATEYDNNISRFNGNLQVGARAVSTFIDAMNMGAGTTSPTAASATPVQDAYITRTGYLSAPVSAGDMFVNRDSLARAIATPAGGMVAGAGGAQQVGATPQSQQSGSRNSTASLELSIPVTVDGREIARAVGSYNLQVDERRGVSITPGSRRRVMENGVR